MDLHILEHRVRVLSLARRGLWLYTHPLLKLLFLPQRCRCKFFSLTETPEDYTIMLDEEGFKELPPSEFMQVADSTWLVLSVVSNGRAPSGCQATGVTKIARSVIAPLAEHHVSVLMLSTYQTDFILVRERDLPVVIHTLAGEFDIYKEESGECVPVTCDDVSNGFLKPKPAASPTLHPVQSPQTRFCVMAVAPDTLPAIATMLIDVLFYSHSPPREAGTGSQDLDSITFFSFSLIEGYISIVMDAETQKRFPSDLLLTSSTGELWRMVRIGGQPLGFDECGIVAQIAEPLAAADISAYYISTFNFDHASLRRASPRSSSCCSSVRRAADSGWLSPCRLAQHGGTVGLPFPPPPTPPSILYFLILRLPLVRGRARCSVTPCLLGTWWLQGPGGLVAVGQCPVGGESVPHRATPQARQKGHHPLSPVLPAQGWGAREESGCPWGPAGGGDVLESSDVPPWCWG
ncbi:cytosolic arginine sensor for mTORC1 subunit 1 isoform X2 [Falco rusticolus]|uniref:cytosolic arginine sensor for mTORC1 subunit 1 isoform X2 n=1 Tax=Falco rusticolus TaxID=120794 RepID=UPI0018867E79|nr:cytosolic arginine sensor for mTORC1 subunit 1 isoform X2 [Falco rusticolus]